MVDGRGRTRLGGLRLCDADLRRVYDNAVAVEIFGADTFLKHEHADAHLTYRRDSFPPGW
jgi:hypothetical protein